MFIQSCLKRRKDKLIEHNLRYVEILVILLQSVNKCEEYAIGWHKYPLIKQKLDLGFRSYFKMKQLTLYFDQGRITSN